MKLILLTQLSHIKFNWFFTVTLKLPINWAKKLSTSW